MKHSQTIAQEKSINRGDIFALGENRLMCGDARNEQDVAKLLSGSKIKAVVSDPPYGISYTQSKEGFVKVKVPKNIENDDISNEDEYADFTQKWIVLCLPFLERKNAVYIFNSDKMLFALYDGMKKSGIRFGQLIVWVKNHSVIGRKDYLPAHELIAYGWYGTHEFRKSKDKSVLFYPKPSKSSLHPTMKPVALIRHLILNNTGVGDVVYDPFGGSGTALVASEQTKRKCYMMECDPDYCRTIIERFEKLSGIKAKKI